MENNNQNNNNSNTKKISLFYNQDAFNTICNFLEIPELVALLSTSKESFQLTNSYIKYFLFKHKFIDEINPTFPNDHYFKIWRSFFCRDLNVANLTAGNLPRPIEKNNFQRYSRFSTMGIKDFSLGTKFTVFHLYNGSMIFIKTEEYLNPLFDPAILWRKNTRTNVKNFSTSSKNLVYLTGTGQLCVIFHQQDVPSSELSEGILESTIMKPILFYTVAYTHAIIAYEDKVKVGASKDDQHNEEEKLASKDSQASEQDRFVTKRVVQSLSLIDLHPQDLNARIRLTEISGLDNLEIIDLCVGSSHAYFVDSQNLVYECDMSIINNEKHMALPFEALRKKTIRRVFSGWSYYFAVEQDLIKGLSSWTNEEVLAWARKVGFQDFFKILKYEGITGEVLANADRRFVLDTLGMTREDLQSKFFYELSKVVEDSKGAQKLYGWGNNNAGQLAANTGTLAIKTPQNISLPQLGEDEEIEKMECGYKSSAILTNHGRLFISDPFEKKAISKEEPVKEESKRKNSYKEERSNKKDKNDHEKHDKFRERREKYPPSAEKEKEKENRWDEVTYTATTLKDKRTYKIVNVSLSKDYLGVLGAYMGTSKKDEDLHPHQILLKQVTQGQGQKFKGGDHIINRILWDKSYDKSEFRVGYEDRFLGMMEMPFEEFINSEVPQHRIKFFKRKGYVMWDRSKRINNF